MNNNRRKFLQNSSLLVTGYLLAKPFKTVAGTPTGNFLNTGIQSNAVSIMHTNDLNGRLSPFNYGQLTNIGGLYNIHSAVNNKNGSRILVDAGNFLDGASQFSDQVNMISLMNKANYTAVTIGDTELSKGEEHLASLIGHMNFNIVNCNYNFSNPVLKAKILPYHIVRYGNYKIGITGVGPVLSNKGYAKDIQCSHPYERANEVAKYLKGQLNCDLVVCLSHLGYEHKNGLPDNKKFAAASENIDIIIGGHDKAIAHPQLIAKNNEKKQVVVSNGGYGGSVMGTVTFGFDKDNTLQTFNSKNYIPGSIAGSSFYEGYKKLSA